MRCLQCFIKKGDKVHLAERSLYHFYSRFVHISIQLLGYFFRKKTNPLVLSLDFLDIL